MADLKYVDWDGLVYYDGKIKEYIQDRDESYLKMGGILTFENLPDPTYYNLNTIYKITDAFVTNSRFETPGLECKENTWVQCVDLHDDASRYRYIIFNEEIIGGTADIDLSDYYTKSETDARIDQAVQSVEQNISNTYVTQKDVNTIVSKEIEEQVLVEIDKTVVNVVQDKIDSGEIAVSVNSIMYGDF